MRFTQFIKTRLAFLALLSLPLVAVAKSSDTAAISAPTTISASDSAKPANAPSPGVVFDRTLTLKYLKPASIEVGNPLLTVVRYSAAEGLVAAYQSESGKRIMFTAKPAPAGKMVPMIFHLDRSTQQIEQLLSKSKRVDENGEQVKDIELAGVDLTDMLKTKRLAEKKDGSHAVNEKNKGNQRKMKQFLEDESGDALLEGLPALYAALGEIDHATPEAGRSKYLVPFGAIAMAIQLGGDHHKGFKHADRILGAARAKEMRDNCADSKDCLMQGKNFMVHQSGLFDVVSKSKSPISKRFTPKTERFSTNFLQTSASMSAECNQIDACFGMCGPGCFTPGEITTSECYGHDLCVCNFGHLGCMVTVPDECIGCSSLVDASISMLESAVGSFIDTMVNWVIGFLNDDVIAGFFNWLCFWCSAP